MNSSVCFSEPNSEEIKAAKDAIKDSQQFFREQFAKHRTKLTSELNTLFSHGRQPDNSKPKTDDDLLRRLGSISLEQLSAYMSLEVQRM